MNSTLTLKLDQDVIRRSKAYAARKGTSLSKIVESYLRVLVRDERSSGTQITGTVAELAGILSDPNAED